jgi:hypothetical protein
VLNPICHLLALLGAHLVLHISRIRVNQALYMMGFSMDRIQRNCKQIHGILNFVNLGILLSKNNIWLTEWFRDTHMCYLHRVQGRLFLIIQLHIESWIRHLHYRVIKNDCRGFNNLSYTIHLSRSICIFYLFYNLIYFLYLIEQHSKFLLHTLQVLYMCTLCDSTNINTIIEFVPHKTPSHCRSPPS